MATTPNVGDLAPEFTLPGISPASGEQGFTLSAARGRPLVLAFYPGDETPVCTRQLCSYQSELDVLTGLDAQLWGISSQGIESHQRFQANRGLSFPLLSDEHDEVFRLYGLGSLLHRRAIFVIDAEGRIAWKHVSTTGLTYQKTDRIAEVLRGLPKSETPYPTEKASAKASAKPRARRTTKSS